MKLFLLAFCLWAHICGSNALQYATIEIHGSSLKQINNAKYTSRDLLGVTFYKGLSELRSHNQLDKFHNELGVNIVSFAQTASEMLIPKTNKWRCCNKVGDLRNHVKSGEACRTFANSYTTSIFTDPYFRQTQITPFIYVRDVCKTGESSPRRSHCAATMADGQAGVPKNDDGWWTELLSAYVTCALQARRDLKYFHLWNEPNAFFHDLGYTGDYFAKFYAQVATKIKREHPNVKLGGAVTSSVPSKKDNFEQWWIPLMERTLKTNPQTLDFFDWHAYDHSIIKKNMQSEWDVVVATSEAISLYAGKKYGKYLKSCMTETNYDLNSSVKTSVQKHWNLRSISNAKQVIGLSHIPDKFDKRLLFDARASDYAWVDSVDYEAHKVLKYIQGRPMVDFEVVNNANRPSNRQGSFFNENIMVQIVWDVKTKQFYTVIVNDNELEEVYVHLNDLDRKFRFNSPAQMAWWTGKKVEFRTYGFSVKQNEAWIYMKRKSIAVLTANTVTIPQSTVKQQQFGSNLACVMALRKNNTETSFTCSIKIWRAGKARRARLEMGLFYGSFGYKWTISAQFKGKYLWSVKDYVPVLRYNEFSLPAQTLAAGGYMRLSISTKKNQRKWIPKTRLGYVAVTIDYV